MNNRRLKVAVLIGLTLLTFLVFWQVTSHEFVIFDDEVYVTQNDEVQKGLSWDGVAWAFTTTHANFWHPLTWLSHMLDCRLFGLNPAGHHLTSLLLHIANTLLLFLVFHRMTGALWPSAFVAALFACHPLHVESVAWVSERKDVLSTLFWMLTLGAYVRYVEHPRGRAYLLAVVFFSLGLMAKPMLVTLPFVLLLLDYWPLDRLDFGQQSHRPGDQAGHPGYPKSSFFHLLLEKVPFLVLSAVSCIVAYTAQAHGGAIKSSGVFSIDVRIANALISYVSYLEKTFWPHHLAVFYPHPGTWPVWQIAGAGLLLVSISALVLLGMRKKPYLTLGWFWYLGTLVPVIGLVQVGIHAMADRYTYVPLIGVFIMIAWGLQDIAKRWRPQRVVLGLSAAAVICAFTISSARQLNHWQNSSTLFQHALNVTEDNYGAHNNLGLALAQRGKLDEAIDHYLRALEIKPVSPMILN
ncbi:MAG: glycosyltransferase family 39 protein, partial [Deltaproteobacteria bacterium]|nr:glycosyltransferase family 39 protein [Deltaproteobacteria bacterium]